MLVYGRQSKVDKQLDYQTTLRKENDGDLDLMNPTTTDDPSCNYYAIKVMDYD